MELLIVMALLALFLIASLFGWRVQLAKARDSERKSKLHDLKIALNSYLEDHGCFPDPGRITCDSNALSPYLPLIPCDPINNAVYKFVYDKESCNSFKVYAKLEWEVDPQIGVVGCQNGCGPQNNYNYYVASDNKPSNGTGEEGVPPTCGSGTKYCFPNICASCCPGSSYRCSVTGKRCILDTTCNL